MPTQFLTLTVGLLTEHRKNKDQLHSWSAIFYFVKKNLSPSETSSLTNDRESRSWHARGCWYCLESSNAIDTSAAYLGGSKWCAMHRSRCKVQYSNKRDSRLDRCSAHGNTQVSISRGRSETRWKARGEKVENTEANVAG